ncbi:hypothetical protein [Yersinia phage YeP4]|nr:hypothetical protein [Yersinia phage YeP4]
MNSLKKMQHRYRLTGADFSQHPSPSGVLYPLYLLCVALFLFYLAR